MTDQYKPVATASSRIKEALELRGMKAIDLAKQSGVSKASISGYMLGKYEPKQDALFQMGRVLDVAEMWLAGYDVPMERTAGQKKNDKLAQLVMRMRRDDKLFSIVSKLSDLPEDQLNGIDIILTGLSTQNTSDEVE